MKPKKLRYECHKCSLRFSSWQKRGEHMKEAHKPPAQTEKRFIRVGESANLLQGTNLKLGDKIRFTKDGVITKITLTEGSNTAAVQISVLRDSWSQLFQ